MTTYTPTFSVQDYELRNYTSPYLTSRQTTEVTQVEERVQGQLDFVAQMLGWNGPNYWGNLPATADQKRQLLGGTFGVYNSYLIPEIYEIRNFDNKIVINRLQFLRPGVPTQVARIVLGDNVYQIQSVEVEGDKYAISIGTLTSEFFNLIESNTQVLVEIPNYRPAPFNRQEIGVSGDYSYICGQDGSTLTLYPGYDSRKQFRFLTTVLFEDSTYYFDRPVYVATDSTTLAPVVSPEYDSRRELWYLKLPGDFAGAVGLTAYLVQANSNATQSLNTNCEIVILRWEDPSDWGSINVLNNFYGVWGNKGGDLPFNFVFDALSIHGFNEQTSVVLPEKVTTISYDDIVNYVYYQKIVASQHAPGTPEPGDLWWNDVTGVLSTWIPDTTNCAAWVQIDYRDVPILNPLPEEVYANVAAFQVGSSTLPDGTLVRIQDITGLSVADGVIGVQGTLNSPGYVTLFKDNGATYWTPTEFGYPTVSTFATDSLLLPAQIPTYIYDSTGLTRNGGNFTVPNLSITITGNYVTLLVKYYDNQTWQLYPDSILKYIANSTWFGSDTEGLMWWDYAQALPEVRAAAIYYDSAWVQVNSHAPGAVPAPVFNPTIILFYCNGVLLQPNVSYVTNDYIFQYSISAATGEYTFNYNARTFTGRVQLPAITISDALTTTYRADISNLVFSGLTYTVSPNVQNAESPLRLWKSQALQVAETVEHLAEDNYINPLLADLNDGPAQENWEKYFIRLPLEYGRNEGVWQKVSLICQNFGYWGSSIEPERMRCPPEDNLPAIYEELFLYDQPVPDYTYVYAESYLYSNIAYYNSPETGAYANAGVFPASDVQFDEFFEAETVDYDPLHNRIADTTSPVTQGYGDWEGDYVNISPCVGLTGFLDTDLKSGGVTRVAPPVWDASIYKFAPTCQNAAESYTVDANHYKIGYAYFIADASAAEDAFFDISKEAAWRYPITQTRTLYLTRS